MENKNTKKASLIFSKVGFAFQIIGFIILILGVVFFTITANQVFLNSAAIKAVFAMSLLIFPLLTFLLLRKNTHSKLKKVLSIILILISIALFLYELLESIVIDYFQPLSLSTLSSTLLIVGVVVMLFGGVLSLITKKENITIATTCMLIMLMITGTVWANTQGYKEFTNVSEKTFLFMPNESGYTTFRIPSLYAVNRHKIDGATISHDPLYAFAEGRINSSKDKGDIDIVYKYSVDGGKNWSEVKTLLSYGAEVGKYGNPTVVYNEDTKVFHMFFMKASEKDNYHYKSYSCVLNINDDFSLTVDKDSIKDISLKSTAQNEGGGSDGVRSDTLMVGPGKGAFLSNNEKGVIVMPCSNNKHSFVVYSLDDGKTWENLDVDNEVKSAGFGNECEATFVKDKLVMVVRENRGCSSFHSEQYQRFAVSENYGKTFEKAKDSTLKSPICMSSVATFNDKLIVSFPDDFYTRANLTIGLYDNGFKTLPLYSGAAGYSSIVVDSDSNVYVLSEVGKVNYNENLVFLKVNMDNF